MIGPSLPDAVVNRVLVVEDDRDEAEFLRLLLQQQGMDVDVAKDGGQAHATFLMRRPDFVLLDLILPKVTGFEVCEQLKRLDETVPILILTAIDMEDSRDLARRVGADGYLAKPYDPSELLEQMRLLANAAWARTHLGREQSAEPEKVRFECTECGKRLKVSAAHRGRTLNCPRCGQPVTVPRHI